MNSAKPNSSVGLDSASTGEATTGVEAFRFVSATERMKKGGKVLRDAPREKLRRRFPTQAPVPEGTVGAETKLRMAILQMSLFPNVVNGLGNTRSPGNVDFGEDHMTPS